MKQPPHPAAEVFPMLDDDELDELAADIGAHGLLMPLLVGQLNGEHVLVDGRNRREACRRAGIVSNYTLLSDGEDLSARILSENVYRRHLTQGQRAIVIAKLFATNKLTQEAASKQTAVKRARIAKAAVVLKHAPDLANSILAGSISLGNAYEEARIRKGRADTHESRFKSLKAAAPDLAELVVEGQLNLEEAQAALDQRVSQEGARIFVTNNAGHALPVGNINRRHMSKGQRAKENPNSGISAMTAQRRYMSKGQRALVTARLSDFLTTREAGTLSGTNRDYISRARTVDNAYEEARLRRGQRAIVVAKVTRNLSVRQVAEEVWSETDHGASGRWWRRKSVKKLYGERVKPGLRPKENWPRVWFPNRPPVWSTSLQLWTHTQQLLRRLWHSRCGPREQLAGIASIAREGN
jgi:ParB/RepB/Spo0J family partition protein